MVSTSLSAHSVLVATLDEYEETGSPVPVHSIATGVGAGCVEVRPILDSLSERDFLVETDDGYRPTVTARQFLDLEGELDEVVLDVVAMRTGSGQVSDVADTIHAHPTLNKVVEYAFQDVLLD